MSRQSIPGILRLVRLTPGTRSGMVVETLKRDYAFDLMDAWHDHVERKMPPILTIENCGPDELSRDAHLVLVFSFIDIDAVDERETLYDWEPVTASAADSFCRMHFQKSLGQAEQAAMLDPVRIQLPEKANTP